MQENIIFPKEFLFGASTSSHQVEGNNTNDWTEWEQSDKRTKYLKTSGLEEKYGLQNFISGKSCEHYNRYEDDFKMAKELGHNATRISIEWSRIEPKEGEFDEKELNHYKNAVKTIQSLGMEPFVTLYHWTLPLWVKNKKGWQNKETIDYFSRYAAKVVEHLKDDVKFWITINEPEIYSSQSYLLGVWPPQQKSLVSYLRVNRNLIKGHKKAFLAIKKIQPEARVGIAKNNIYFEAYKNKIFNSLLKKGADWWWNFYFLNKIKNHQDFIGLNFYFYNVINYGFNKNKKVNISDLGWDLNPQAILPVLKDLKKYHKPIYITENGLADYMDEKRSWFILESLKSVGRAISEGVDVRGYFHWSLMDNFEWADGYWPRFGLIEIDYKTMQRKIRPSALIYKDICINKMINNQLCQK